MKLDAIGFKALKYALLYSPVGRAAIAVSPETYFDVSKRILERYHSLLGRRRPERFTDAKLFTTLRVDPNSIEHVSGVKGFYGEVIGGDWDVDTPRFEDNVIYRSLKLRFEHGYDWAETPLPRHLNEKMADESIAWDKQSIRERCNAIDDLYEEIKQNGYKSQKQLIEQGEHNPNNFDPIHYELNEVNVDIGRNGGFYWTKRGQHRLSIAKLLAIESIPVIVRVRHREWQRKRRQPPENRPSHPDFRTSVSTGR